MAEGGGLLDGIRVIDASRVLAGPFCGQILGDLGAEVIKIEHPTTGDETRAWGPPFAGEWSAYYLSCNRNKKGITLDLGQPKGRAIFDQLVQKSDVLLENFRAASAAKLGLGPDGLLKLNPRLIMCSISGFGRSGPLADLPGYDFAIQALSGLMAITGPAAGPPFKVGVAVADVLTGLHAAVAVLACLNARSRTGHGYAIDVALLDCALASQVNVAQAFLTSGTMPARQGNAHLQIVPYQLFATADSFLVLAVGNDGQWQRFCEAAKRKDLAEDSRFTTNTQRVRMRDTLVPLLETIMKEWTSAEWQDRLQDVNVPHAPVWDYAELLAHPQVKARSMRVTISDPDGQPVDLLGSPFHIAGVPPAAATMPPAHGQHTDEVLANLLGMDHMQIKDLRRKGVV
jgi:crotonobetainyl-CoA:carnitine CoA-transferase CaiB-like acyl-CoA transferase